MESSGQISLILLCGLPATGKSTLCDELKQWDELKSTVCVIVSFDAILSRFFDLTSDENAWKISRSKVARAVESLIQYLLEGKAIDGPSYHLHQITDSYFQLSCNDCCAIGKEFERLRAKRVLLVLDDNFFYESMRYEYFKIAKYYRIGFGQVFFDCTLDTSLSRNASRNESERVSGETIIRMHSIFERPKVEENWQRNTATVPETTGNDQGGLCRNNLVALIRSSFDNPVLIADEQELRQRKSDEDRQRNSESTLHQAELLCRRLVSTYMKSKCETQSDSLASPLVVLPSDSRTRLAMLTAVKQKVMLKVRTFEHLDLNSLEQFVNSTFTNELAASCNMK